MSAGDVTLTEAERDLSVLLRRAAREHLGLSDGDYWPSDVADAQARAVLAARTTAATGDDLRDRVEDVLDSYAPVAKAQRGCEGDCGCTDCDMVADLRRAVAVSAPVVSRPEAEVTRCPCGAWGKHTDEQHDTNAAAVNDWKAEALQEAADEVEALRTFAHGNNPTSKAHVIGFGTARRVAARLLRDRAASLDSGAP